MSLLGGLGTIIRASWTLDAGPFLSEAARADAAQKKVFDGAKAGPAAAGSAWKTFGSVVASTAGAMATAAVAAGGFALAFKVSKDVLEFEEALSQVNTLLAESPVEAFGKSMAEVRREILALSGGLGTATEITQGLYNAIGSGIAPAQALTFVAEAAKLARAGLADTDDTVRLLSASLNAYGASAADATRFSDVLFRTVERGIVTLPELVSSLGSVIPIAAKLGVPIEELGAAIATLTAQGVKGDEAVTQLRSALSGFVQNADAFREAGIDIVKVLGEQGLAGALAVVEKATGGEIEAIKALMPELRGLLGLLGLGGPGAERFAENLLLMGNAAGSTERAFQIMRHTGNFALAELTEQVQSAALLFGTSILEHLVDPILLAADTVRDFAQSDDFAAWVEGAAAGVGSFIDLLGELVTVTGDVVDAFGDMTEAVVEVVRLMSNDPSITAMDVLGASIVTVREIAQKFFGYIGVQLGRFAAHVVKVGEVLFDALTRPFREALVFLEQFFTLTGRWSAAQDAQKAIALIDTTAALLAATQRDLADGVQVLIKDYNAIGAVAALTAPKLAAVSYEIGKSADVSLLAGPRIERLKQQMEYLAATGQKNSLSYQAMAAELARLDPKVRAYGKDTEAAAKAAEKQAKALETLTAKYREQLGLMSKSDFKQAAMALSTAIDEALAAGVDLNVVAEKYGDDAQELLDTARLLGEGIQRNIFVVADWAEAWEAVVQPQGRAKERTDELTKSVIEQAKATDLAAEAAKELYLATWRGEVGPPEDQMPDVEKRKRAAKQQREQYLRDLGMQLGGALGSGDLGAVGGIVGGEAQLMGDQLGAMAGSSISTALGGGLAGNLLGGLASGGISAAVGLAISAIGKLLSGTPAWKKNVQDVVQKQMGVAISQGTAEAVLAIKDQTGPISSSLRATLGLDLILKEATIGADNVSRFVGEFEAMAGIAQGVGKQADYAQQHVGPAYEQLRAKMVEAGLAGTVAMHDLNVQAQALAKTVPEIAAAFKVSLVGAAGDLSNLFGGTWAVGAGQDAILGAFSADLLAGLKAIPGASREALGVLGENLDELVAGFKRAGTEIPDGIAALLGEREFYRVNEGLLAAIDSTAAFAQQLGNIGFISEAGFNALAQQVQGFSAGLTTAGRTGAEALGFIAPVLQEIINASQREGYAIDAATQALIDQAAGFGLVKVAGTDAFASMRAESNYMLGGMAAIFGKEGKLAAYINETAATAKTAGQTIGSSFAEAGRQASGALGGVANQATGILARIQQVAREAGSVSFSAIKGGVPSYATGIDRVPEDMLALIHRNEAVIPAHENLSRRAASAPQVVYLTNVVQADGREVFRETVEAVVNEGARARRVTIIPAAIVAR